MLYEGELGKAFRKRLLFSMVKFLCVIYIFLFSCNVVAGKTVDKSEKVVDGIVIDSTSQAINNTNGIFLPVAIFSSAEKEDSSKAGNYDFNWCGIYEDAWFWFIAICLVSFLVFTAREKWFSNKWIVGVCAFSPVILFYFLRSGTYWEGAFSVPPYIELTVLLLASVLSFIAFYVQYRFNKMQKKDIDKERAENVFFKMYEEHIRLGESICVSNIGVNKRVFHFIMKCKLLPYS